MSNLIQDKILALAPAATVKEGEVLTVTVPAENFHAVAEMLRDDRETQFDFLVCMTGADWGETLGVVYHLRSTTLGHEVVLRIETADREHPVLPSVCDLWHSANLNEREVYDFYGIRFTGHPDMRRLYLRNDWVGYPFRKDYDANPEINPVPETNEPTEDEAPCYELKDGKIEKGEHVLFDEEEYVVNIGPQHPATHGVLRFRTSLEGEIIKKIDVHCGYIHRGAEKMCESMTYPQTLSLTDRFDYLGAHQNRHALCMCIEKAMQLEVPARAQYIRTIMDELQRIDSHLLFYATMCMDMGGLTPFFYGFRDREMVLDIFEGTTGGRLIQNYNVIGGVMADLAPDFVEKVQKIHRLPARCAERVPRGIYRQRDRTAASQGRRRPFEGGCDLLRCDGSHGPSFGVGLRCAQGTSLRRLRQGRIQRGDPYRRRLVRPLHGAYGGDPRVAAHY